MTHEFSGQSISDLLFEVFGNLISEDQYDNIVIVADKNYESLDSSSWLTNLIGSDPILSRDRYRKDIFDCDDYVTYLKSKISLLYANNSKYRYAACIGFIITTVHAFNIMINNNGELYIINTQSDNIGTLNTSTATDNQIRNFLQLKDSNSIKLIYI